MTDLSIALHYGAVVVGIIIILVLRYRFNRFKKNTILRETEKVTLEARITECHLLLEEGKFTQERHDRLVAKFTKRLDELKKQ